MKTNKLSVKAIAVFSTILALFIFNPAKSNAVDQDLITKGTAKFLMDRANAIVLDQYLKKMTENKLFVKYFPVTKKYLDNNNYLYNLPYDDTFKNSFKEDLIYIFIMNYKNDIYNKYKHYFDENHFAELLSENIDTEALKKILEQIPDAALKEYYKGKTFDDIPGMLNYFNKNKDQMVAFLIVYPEILSDFLKDRKINLLNCIKDQSYTNVVNASFELISKIDTEQMITKYKKLKENALFLAKLADAKDIDTVEYVLYSTTLSINSYKSKRNDIFNLFVTSYVGLTGGYEKWQNDNSTSEIDHYYYGVFAPIGIDFAWGDSLFFNRDQNWSISVFFSVFDLGNVINTEYWHKEKATYSFNSVTAPGAYLALGLPDSPFSIGAGAQYANTYKDNIVSDTQRREWKFSAFFAIDIPLFKLW